MTYIFSTEDDNLPAMCSNCEIRFLLVWSRDGVTEMDYCPFCGDAIEAPTPAKEEK